MKIEEHILHDLAALRIKGDQILEKIDGMQTQIDGINRKLDLIGERFDRLDKALRSGGA